MSKYPNLFSEFKIDGLKLANRITMAPLFLSMANSDGAPSEVMLDHYREMGAGGAAMIVVENAAVDPAGMGSPFTLRTDSDDYIPGMRKIADAVKKGGARAILQLNHAGKFAFPQEKWGPSPMETDNAVVKEMTPDEIHRIVEAFAEGARRVKEAGFDGVELHGGTGYLLVQFLSPHTNKRNDEFGGSREGRMKFPLMVVDAVKDAVGENFPVGYRFLADEWLPDGFGLEEAKVYAAGLEKRKVAYLSVMAGTYESFFLPDKMEESKKPGYMTGYAEAIKKEVPKAAVITAGRIQHPDFAEEIISSGKADLVGLARILLADPQWPGKAAGEVDEPINECEPTCSFCMNRVMSGKTSYCIRWPKDRKKAFEERIGETGE